MDKQQKEYFQNVKHVFAKDATGIKVYEELKNAYQERSSFSTDALEMAFKEGQRSVFLELKAIVEAK
jgi:hypothetical protein